MNKIADQARPKAGKFQVPREVIEQYNEEGACRVSGAFSSEWVNGLLKAYDTVVAELRETANTGNDSGVTIKAPNPAGLPAVTYVSGNDGSERLKNVVWYNAFCARWLRESPAADIVGQVIGAKHLQFYWDQYFVKTGNNPSGVTPWHHDIAAFSFYGMQLPSFWIALTDIDENNAPLVTAVGSNKRTHVMYRPLAGTDGVPLPQGYAERDEMMEWINRKDGVLRTWTAKAGDALVIHPYTYHASLPRSPTAGRRVAYTSRWLGDDVVWWKREMTFNYPDDIRFANVKQGMPPPEPEFPIIWHRS